MSKSTTKKLDQLLELQDGRCHWCGSRTVRLSSIDPKKIVLKRQHYVVWRGDSGRTEQALVCSPGSTGVVAACQRCDETAPRLQPESKMAAQTPKPVAASGANRVTFW